MANSFSMLDYVRVRTYARGNMNVVVHIILLVGVFSV